MIILRLSTTPGTLCIKKIQCNLFSKKFTCKCAGTCMYLHACTCVVCVSMCAYVSICVHTSISAHVCMHVCTWVCVCPSVYIHLRVCMYMCVCDTYVHGNNKMCKEKNYMHTSIHDTCMQIYTSCSSPLYSPSVFSRMMAISIFLCLNGIALL